MTDDLKIRKMTTVLYAIISMIVIWGGIFFINENTGWFPIDNYSFHVSTVLLCVVLAIPLAYMLYVGKIVESLIGIMMYPLICGHSVAYLRECPEYGAMIDITVALVSIALVLMIMRNKERILVTSGCILTIGAIVTTVVEGDTDFNVLRGILMIAGGIAFAVHSGIEMHRIALGTTASKQTNRAMSPTAICETVGLLCLGIGLIFEIVMLNFENGTGELLPEIIMASMLIIAMAIALFASVNGSISTGTTILVISTFVLITAIVSKQPSISISNNVRFVLAIPLLFTAYRYHRKNDILLMTATLSFVAVMAFDLIGTNVGSEIFSDIADIVEFAVALLFIYAALARSMFIETGEKKIPLFDNSAFVNEKEIRDRQKTEVRSSMAINSFMMASIALIFLGFYLINKIYEVTKIDDKMFYIALAIISGFVILFSADNFRRGQITEFIGLISIGVFAASFSTCGLYSLPMTSELDLVMTVATFSSGAMLFARRDKWIGSSLMIASIGFLLAVMTSDSVPVAIGGALMIVSGAVIFLVYNYVKLTTKEKNPSIGAHNIDRPMPGESLDMVCLLLLGFVMLLVAINTEFDTKSMIVTTMICGITMAISLYGLMEGEMIYNIPIFGISLMFIVQNLTCLISDGGTLDFICVAFIIVLAFTTLVFIGKKEYFSAVFVGLMVIGLLLNALIGWTPVTRAVLFLTGLVMCLICIYWWMKEERIIDKIGFLKIVQNINRR